jgi:Ca2+-transporting ATPase
VQERRSEESLEALNKLVPHHCHILRDGAPMTALANALVPGDLVTFSTGDRVPADVRLVAAQDLELDESSLTGETRARRKAAPACAPGLPLAERASVAYMGTLVRAGRGQGVVVATGKETEFGAIFSMMEEVARPLCPKAVADCAHRSRRSARRCSCAWTSSPRSSACSRSGSSASSASSA